MSSDEDNDETIVNYSAINLNKLEITTSTIAYDSDLRISYEELSKRVKKDGKVILSVKSTSMPLEECINDGKYSKAKDILKRRKRVENKKPTINYGRPSRQLSGNQLYFQSAVEFVKFYKVDEQGKVQYHNVRISPARGSIQIQGVKEPIFITAEKQIRETLEYIKKGMAIEDNYTLINKRVIIINVKTSISDHLFKRIYDKQNEKMDFDNFKINTKLRIDKIASYLETYMKLQQEGKDSEIPLYIPYKIVLVTNPYETGGYIRIKFITPIKNNLTRRTTVKIFSGSKINFLGSPTPESPYYIYRFLDKFFDIHSEFLFLTKEDKKYNIETVSNYIKDLNHDVQYSWVYLINTKDVDEILNYEEDN